MTNQKKRLRKQILLSLVALFAVITIVSTVSAIRIFAQEPGGVDVQGAISSEKVSVSKFAFIAAAVAFGMGALGAGLAIGNVGAAAMGAIAEKPEIAGQALIFVALAEGLVVFGFITALMILGKV